VRADKKLLTRPRLQGEESKAFKPSGGVFKKVFVLSCITSILALFYKHFLSSNSVLAAKFCVVGIIFCHLRQKMLPAHRTCFRSRPKAAATPLRGTRASKKTK